jgi:hypothetical protein
MKKILSIVLVAMVSFTVPVLAQKPAVVTSDKAGWHKIGETTVNMKTEKDEILVLGKDKFTSLKIKVTDEPVYLASMTIYYENGETEDANISSDLKAGSASKVINLKGGAREIKKVSFVYHTSANTKNEKAHVELYGLK